MIITDGDRFRAEITRPDGWRVGWVISNGERWTIENAPYRRGQWSTLPAECDRGEHASPHPDCICGYHYCERLDDLSEMLRRPGVVARADVRAKGQGGIQGVPFVAAIEAGRIRFPGLDRSDPPGTWRTGWLRHESVILPTATHPYWRERIGAAIPVLGVARLAALRTVAG